MAFIFTDELLKQAQYYISNADPSEIIKKVHEQNSKFSHIFGSDHKQFGNKSPEELIIGWIRGANPNNELRQHDIWTEFNKMINTATYDTQGKYIYRGTDHLPYLSPKVGDIIDYSNWITSWSTRQKVAQAFTHGVQPITIFRLKGVYKALDIRKQNRSESEIVLSASKLKVTAVGECYDCEIYRELKVVIEDNEEYRDMVTCRE